MTNSKVDSILDSDDWLPWGGGVKPQPPSGVELWTKVTVLYTNGRTESGRGGEFNWLHIGNRDEDIVGYRIDEDFRGAK